MSIATREDSLYTNFSADKWCSANDGFLYYVLNIAGATVTKEAGLFSFFGERCKSFACVIEVHCMDTDCEPVRAGNEMMCLDVRFRKFRLNEDGVGSLLAHAMCVTVHLIVLRAPCLCIHRSATVSKLYGGMLDAA